MRRNEKSEVWNRHKFHVKPLHGKLLRCALRTLSSSYRRCTEIIAHRLDILYLHLRFFHTLHFTYQKEENGVSWQELPRKNRSHTEENRRIMENDTFFAHWKISIPTNTNTLTHKFCVHVQKFLSTTKNNL